MNHLVFSLRLCSVYVPTVFSALFWLKLNRVFVLCSRESFVRLFGCVESGVQQRFLLGLLVADSI
jgi:hypothetical protein